jgi:hypothetical protein
MLFSETGREQTRIVQKDMKVLTRFFDRNKRTADVVALQENKKQSTKLAPMFPVEKQREIVGWNGIVYKAMQQTRLWDLGRMTCWMTLFD